MKSLTFVQLTVSLCLVACKVDFSSPFYDGRKQSEAQRRDKNGDLTNDTDADLANHERRGSKSSGKNLPEKTQEQEKPHSERHESESRGRASHKGETADNEKINRDQGFPEFDIENGCLSEDLRTEDFNLIYAQDVAGGPFAFGFITSGDDNDTAELYDRCDHTRGGAVIVKQIDDDATRWKEDFFIPIFRGERLHYRGAGEHRIRFSLFKEDRQSKVWTLDWPNQIPSIRGLQKGPWSGFAEATELVIPIEIDGYLKFNKGDFAQEYNVMAIEHIFRKTLGIRSCKAEDTRKADPLRVAKIQRSLESCKTRIQGQIAASE
jgi:hypothetical protein